MKVALVHDYLTEYGGAERVLEAIHELWPEAPVFTSIIDVAAPFYGAYGQAAQSAAATGWDIRPSRISTLPLASKLAKSFTFFMPLIFESFDLREYDLVISDGTIWSKSVLTTPEQLHIFYCHTPPRWLYGYPGETDRRRLWYLQPLLKPLDNWLRVWDFESAQRPDHIIANSKTVARRINKFWRREAKVIYPPVSMSQCVNESMCQGDAAAEEKPVGFRPRNPTGWGIGGDGGYFLVVSRLSAYKNVDLAIEACNQLNLPLVVVGVGREGGRLQAMAGPTVKLLKFVKDSELCELYKHCKVLIHPASDEDFGIAPVEAMGFGKPVIALRSGGVEETVVEGKTGLFFNEPTAESLVKTIKQFSQFIDSKNRRLRTIDPADCIEQAQRFSKERFQREFQRFVEDRWYNKFKNQKSKPS